MQSSNHPLGTGAMLQVSQLHEMVGMHHLWVLCSDRSCNAKEDSRPDTCAWHKRVLGRVMEGTHASLD